MVSSSNTAAAASDNDINALASNDTHDNSSDLKSDNDDLIDNTPTPVDLTTETSDFDNDTTDLILIVDENVTETIKEDLDLSNIFEQMKNDTELEELEELETNRYDERNDQARSRSLKMPKEEEVVK